MVRTVLTRKDIKPGLLVAIWTGHKWSNEPLVVMRSEPWKIETVRRRMFGVRDRAPRPAKTKGAKGVALAQRNYNGGWFPTVKSMDDLALYDEAMAINEAKERKRSEARKAVQQRKDRDAERQRKLCEALEALGISANPSVEGHSASIEVGALEELIELAAEAKRLRSMGHHVPQGHAYDDQDFACLRDDPNEACDCDRCLG